MLQTSFKNVSNIFRIDPSLLPELLQKYNQASVRFREEEFTQEAEMFVTKISSDKKVPKELRAKFPLYHILMSISKIFFLNEFELVNLSCLLDHLGWKYDEIVLSDEYSLLTEFPISSGVEINAECKRLIIYLLVLTFSLKQYMNEKADVDIIQAYLEKICQNFQGIYNRWTRASAITKFNYSATEINKKFRILAQKDNIDQFNTLKDYNMIAENIMTLTGSYSGKGKELSDTKPMTPVNNPQNPEMMKPNIFHDIPASDFSKNLYYPEQLNYNRQIPQKNMDFFNDQTPVRIPSVINAMPRQQPSYPPMFSNMPMKRQSSFEFYEDPSRKKLKPDENNQINMLKQEQKNSQEFGQNNSQMMSSGPPIQKPNENEEIYLPMPPLLRKKSSTLSQGELEPLNRFGSSSLSFLYDK